MRTKALTLLELDRAKTAIEPLRKAAPNVHASLTRLLEEGAKAKLALFYLLDQDRREELFKTPIEDVLPPGHLQIGQRFRLTKSTVLEATELKVCECEHAEHWHEKTSFSNKARCWVIGCSCTEFVDRKETT